MKDANQTGEKQKNKSALKQIIQFWNAEPEKRHNHQLNMKEWKEQRRGKSLNVENKANMV